MPSMQDQDQDQDQDQGLAASLKVGCLKYPAPILIEDSECRSHLLLRLTEELQHMKGQGLIRDSEHSW